MRVTISKVGTLSANEKFMTLKLMRENGSAKMPRLNTPAACELTLPSGKRISAVLLRQPIRQKDRTIFSIYFHREPYITEEVQSIWPHLHNTSCLSLFIEEKVPEESYKEAESLLWRLSTVTGRPKEDILKELTAFKAGIAGREDLKFVSERQLPIIIEKMKDMASFLQRQTEREEDPAEK
jgi:hypothetical protein